MKTAEEILNEKFKDNLPSTFEGKMWDDKLIEAMHEYTDQQTAALREELEQAKDWKIMFERIREEKWKLKTELEQVREALKEIIEVYQDPRTTMGQVAVISARIITNALNNTKQWKD